MNVSFSSPLVWTHLLAVIPLLLLCFTKYVFFIPVFVLSLMMSSLYHYYQVKKQHNLEKKFQVYDTVLLLMDEFIILYIFIVSPKTTYSLIGAVFIIFSLLFPPFILFLQNNSGYEYFHSIWHLFAIYGLTLILFSLIKK